MLYGRGRGFSACLFTILLTMYSSHVIVQRAYVTQFFVTYIPLMFIPDLLMYSFNMENQVPSYAEFIATYHALKVFFSSVCSLFMFLQILLPCVSQGTLITQKILLNEMNTSNVIL